jgi:thymidylate synthase (FAD)
MGNMKEILKMYDPWKNLRADLFGNTEVEVKLEGITCPVKIDNIYGGIFMGHPNLSQPEGRAIDWEKIERLPALAAGTSYGSKEKLEDPERAIKLNKKLIELGHHVPLEIVTYVFNISGISKLCGAQLSRYRHTGHVSASRRYQQQKPAFVYPLLSYINDEDEVSRRLMQISRIYKTAYSYYNDLRSDGISIGWGTERVTGLTPLHKEDARFVIPAATSTERTWWCNARELRHIFNQRLAPDSEWEIRRLAQMLFNIVYPLTPSLFEDIKERFE